MVCVGIGFCALPILVRAQITVTTSIGTDFRQPANEDPTLGGIKWINSILQQNNSLYLEGMSVPQRAILEDIPATSGNTHALSLSHQANKSATIHAYDYLTSWSQAYAAANLLEPPPPGLLADLFVDECGPAIGPPATTALCTALSASTNCVNANLPDNMGTLLGDNVAASVTAYESSMGNRTFRICAPSSASALTGVSMTFDGYTGGSDSDAAYTVHWTSDAAMVLVEVAGHISVGIDGATGIGIGYGAGRGASAISGGPYHFKLSNVDGISLGSQDNQLKGADVRLPFCPADACSSGGKCDDGNPCTGCVCDEINDSCSNPPLPLSTTCEADGNLCTIDHCNGSGACVTFDDVSCQAPNPPCDGGEVCSPGTGLCVAQADAPLSTSCEADASFCTIDHCDGQGLCVTYNNVSCPGPIHVCDGGTVCDPSTGGCNPLPDPPLSTPCNRDDNACTIDHCDGAGACVTYNNVVCGSGDTCSAGEQCDPQTGQCVMLPNPPSGTPCEADGNLCTIEECNGSGGCAPVGAVDCSGLAGPCTTAACNPTTGNCVLSPKPLSTPCERDGDLCTNDHCDGTGSCVFLDDVVCLDPSGPCDAGQVCASRTGMCMNLTDPAAGTPCEGDNDRCTLEECDGTGACVFIEDRVCPGPTGFCDAGTRCNPATGACDQLSDPVLSTPCEADGNLCTHDHCNGLGQCARLSEVSCAGAVPPCESGQECNPLSGTCVDLPDAPDGTSCGDGLYCNGDETCLAAVCVPGDPPCDDLVACTQDSCDEAGDLCVYTCPTPGITCPPDLTYECDAVGSFGDPTVNDTCTPSATVECVEVVVPGKLTQESTVTRTCTVTNACGKSASCQHTIRIVDTTAPVIICPPDLTFQCDAIGDFGDPIVTDNCDPDPEITIEVEQTVKDCTPQVVAGISPLPKLDVTRTISATDGGATSIVATGNTGNVTQCVQHILIIDTHPPTMQNCPTSVAVCPGQPVPFTPPTCTDSCGMCDVTCTRSDGKPLNDPVESDSVTISCEARDECGNIAADCIVPVIHEFCPIPTVSEWGLVVLSLLLLTGGKIFFGRRSLSAA